MVTKKVRPRRRLLLGVTAAAAVIAGSGVAVAAPGFPINPFGTQHVGTQSNGSILLPDNQSITPLGQRTKFTAEMVGTAVSPDGTKLAVQAGGDVTGASSLNILDAATGKVLQTFGGRNDAPPVYSPDGTALYTATSTASGGGNGTNTIIKYTVDPSTGLVTNPTSPVTLTLPSNQDFPFGLAVSSDGSTLYASLSATNSVGVINTATMTLTTKVPVGNAPQALAISGNQLFVANRGGRTATTGDTTNLSHGTPIVSDPVTGAPTTGTVSVIDLGTNKVSDTIKVGLSPASLTVHDGSVFVTNSGTDTVSIVDATSHQVTQTFNVEPLPGSTVGSAPNSVAFAGPNTLLVSVGADNAIAEFHYTGPRNPVAYRGLIPTDWYPNQVTYDAKVGKVFVANQYGIGTNGANQTHAMIGTLTTFAPPSNQTLGTLTGQVFADNGWNHLPSSNQTSGGKSATQAPVAAIPAKLGQPSAIKHVFLIIKENRTYDQVLGDVAKGNGDTADTNYGQTVTPNEHSLSNSFTLFDNFYDPAQQSADGHNWILQGDANDYLAQDQNTDFARSYPYPGGDSLAYQRDGFLWNDVQSVGGTVRNYGEFESIESGKQGSWQQYYADSQIMEGKATGTLPVSETSAQWATDVPSLEKVTNPSYPHFDPSIPDQYRTDVWEQDFAKQVQNNDVPNLTVMELGTDHTGGAPTAEAQVADNDLATGRIIDDISHSKVWKDSAVFVEEDDTQAGLDHVDGHRGPLWIASPYAKRGAVDSNYYTQINVTKTIEQILGAQPMNQMDRAAVPMFDAFTNKPNDAPYTALPETVPLTEGVTGLIPVTPAANDSATTAKNVTATTGPAAPTPPAAEKSVADQWKSWLKTDAQPKLTGPHAAPDATNPAQMNRYDWYTSTNWSKPYPGDKSILAPDQVPGRNAPTGLTGDH